MAVRGRPQVVCYILTMEKSLLEEEYESARLTLGEMGPLGDTLAELDGESINVFGGIPGEEVVCRIPLQLELM